MEIIKVKKLHPQAKLPKKATKGSAFFDIYSLQDISIVKGKFIMARTGLAFEIPEGYFVETRVRSSLAKNGVIKPNDHRNRFDYRGENLIPLYGLFCNFIVLVLGQE
jgi:dUTP pyrophosphatase